VHGNWKSLIRLHNGNSLTAVPLFLPEDEAIPAKEVPAPAAFTREFIADHEILQREAKSSGGAITVLAYSVVALIALSLLALLAWGLHRVAAAAGAGDRRPDDRQPPAAPAGPPRVAAAR
jgi:hypothetical protein